MTSTRIVSVISGLAVVAVWSIAAADQQVPPVRPRPNPGFEAPACRAVIAGVVTREAGNLQHGPPRDVGVPRIQVQLLDSQGARLTESRTDREGRYSFRGQCEGTYTVCPGTPCPTGGPVPSRYLPATREVRVSRAGLRGVDFQQLPPPHLPQQEPRRR